MRTAAGVSALAVGASMGWPAAAFASHSSNDDPKPIPGGTDLLALLGQGSGPLFHFFFPAFGEDTSTITDFKGSIAAAEIQGTGLATPDGPLTYDVDMRFMSGEYVAMDGRHRQGTFGFVWLDLFTGQFAQQNHDFNPGIRDFHPGIDGGGLFWTTAFPRSGTSIDLEDGTARMHAEHMAVPDYIDIFNSAGVRKPPIPPIPSFVSFDVRWKAKPKAKLTRITNTGEQVTGKFIDSNATIVWSANQPSTGFRFTSAPTPTKTISGVIGRERNGRFFSDRGGGDDDD